MSNFSFSLSVFKRLVLQIRKNQGLFGKGSTTLRKRPFENIAGKGENAGFPLCFLPIPKHILIFQLPLCFLSISKHISIFQFNLLFVNALNLAQSKILSFGKELINKNFVSSREITLKQWMVHGCTLRLQYMINGATKFQRNSSKTIGGENKQLTVIYMLIRAIVAVEISITFPRLCDAQLFRFAEEIVFTITFDFCT